MKNKGYYGWIHSLNEAGIQAHKKGIEMLAEQHARKGEMLTEVRSEASKAQQRAYDKNRRALEAQANALLKKNPGEFVDQGADETKAEIYSAGMRAGSGTKRVEGGFRKGKNVSTDEIDLTPDDGSETGEHSGTEEISRLPNYGSLTANARAETARLAQLQDRTSKPRDVNQDGIANAQDSEADGADGEINGLALDAAPQTRVHPEPWYKSFGEADWAGAKLNGYKDKSDAQLEDEELRRLTMPESVSHKISKMMNEGKKAVRGRVAKGDDSDVPSRTPNREGAPKGIFRGTESPSEKVGRILEIVRDGPEKHGEEKHSWASSALETMQKQLRKN